MCLDHFQGNRTPFTDPLSRGALAGLTLKHGRFPVCLFVAVIKWLRQIGPPDSPYVVGGGGVSVGVWGCGGNRGIVVVVVFVGIGVGVVPTVVAGSLIFTISVLFSIDTAVALFALKDKRVCFGKHQHIYIYIIQAVSCEVIV